MPFGRRKRNESGDGRSGGGRSGGGRSEWVTPPYEPRPGVAGIAAHEDDVGGYLYLRRELLVGRWALDVVLESLGDLVTDPPPYDERAGWVVDEDRVARALEAAGLARIGLVETAPVPDVVRRLRAPIGGDVLPVHPHAVMLVSPIHTGGKVTARVPGIAPTVEELREPVSTVAVIDTGLHTSWHADPAMSSRVVQLDQADVDEADVDGDLRLDAAAGHGTFVTGVLAQTTRHAQVLPRKVVSQFGFARDGDVAQAIREVTGTADVVVLALGGYTADDLALPATSSAIRSLLDTDPGAVVVACAGNEGAYRPFHPAASKSVVAVGATDLDGAPAAFSNRGWWVDCSTRGDRVVSQFVEFDGPIEPDSGTDVDEFKLGAVWSGTSFSAPRVAARIVEDVAASGGSMTHAEAARRLLGSSQGRRLEGFGLLV